METSHQPHLVPGRACGTCMMCCKVPYIKEFEKPAGVWCRHAVPGKGCGIYESRPGSIYDLGDKPKSRAVYRRCIRPLGLPAPA